MIIDRSTTALVVDSTADLPEILATDPNLTLVPPAVFFAGEPYLDWIELSPELFYRKLAASSALPTTSQPVPGVWMELYDRLLRRYRRVYSVHLSGEFSGTYETAATAAAQFDGVKVVDSRPATGGMALLVDRLVERIDRGTSEEEFDAQHQAGTGTGRRSGRCAQEGPGASSGVGEYAQRVSGADVSGK